MPETFLVDRVLESVDKVRKRFETFKMSLISGDDDRGDDVLGVVDRDDVFGVVTLDDVFGVDDLDVVRDANTFPTPTTSSFDDSSDVGVDDVVVVMTLPTSMFKSLLKLLSDKFALSMFKLLR